MLDDPKERTALAKANVEASKSGLDERDTLTRDMMARAAVRLNIPLRSVTELKRHLRLTISELEAICDTLDRGHAHDRTLLMGAQGRIRELGRRLNAYRVTSEWD